MNGSTEKPLLAVGGSPIIARVLDALYGSHEFEGIVAVVSPNTPETRQFLNSMEMVQVLETPGKGYPSDLSMVLSRLRPERVFVISADMPLMTSQVVSEIASAASQTKPVLSVVLRKEFVESLGFSPSVTFTDGRTGYCQSGISIFDTSHHSDGQAAIMEEDHLVMDRIELAVNVNTKEELRLAEKLFVQRA